MKLTTDILPRALYNFCEEIFRIKNTIFILLKTLKFIMAFAIRTENSYKTEYHTFRPKNNWPKRINVLYAIRPRAESYKKKYCFRPDVYFRPKVFFSAKKLSFKFVGLES